MGEIPKAALIPQPCRALPVLPAASSPRNYYERGISAPLVARRRDKKKAGPKTSLKVFRRGCLKGTPPLPISRKLRKCEEKKSSCMKCNHVRNDQ
ncbi:hypothetical protein [Sphingobium lactosutens]|uniref:hypothetical protein n=1 Tax=Sphingobium lactosutens TaxID=522773 RepID=UPI0015B9BCA4|nr:hypothetical protein [Sphingobium lactosutens]